MLIKWKQKANIKSAKSRKAAACGALWASLKNNTARESQRTDHL